MKAHEMIARVRDLPTVSLPALQLVNLLGDPQAALEDAVQIIKQDAVLTAKLLRVCNSPCLAFEEPITSVNQAVMLLGHKRVYNMVMAMSLRGPLDVPLLAYDIAPSDLWRHSLLTATTAELLVDQGINIEVDGSTGFTIGLLHDIGKLITNRFFTPQSLASMRRLIAKGQPAIEAEKNVLGTDHAEVGAALAYVWHLPDVIIEAIGLHHTPPSTRQLSALAHLANRIAHESEGFGEDSDTSILARCCSALEPMGFAADGSQDFLAQVLKISEQTEELVAVGC